MIYVKQLKISNMIFHLFPKSQFTEEYIYFINNNFDSSNHIFILYTNVRFDLPESIYDYENVYDYDKYNTRWLHKELRKAERIIIHNLGLLVPELSLFFIDNSLVRKSIWLMWGADLYCYLDKRSGLAEKIVELMRIRIIRSFPVIASLADGDYDLVVKWYGCKGKGIRLDYCEEKTINLMDNYLQKKRKNDGIIRVLVGNSATKSNQHIEAFAMLEHLKGENIRIYVPLAYGDKEYAIEVISEGKRIFGNKLVPLEDYMSREEYYKILYDIDVGVFNNNRQQGTGTIEALLYFGRKIFLRNDTSMWDEWVKKEGYLLDSIDELLDISFDELNRQSSVQSETNNVLIRHYFDKKERISEWERVFTMPLSER